VCICPDLFKHFIFDKREFNTEMLKVTFTPNAAAYTRLVWLTGQNPPPLPTPGGAGAQLVYRSEIICRRTFND